LFCITKVINHFNKRETGVSVTKEEQEGGVLYIKEGRTLAVERPRGITW
jgi:hypothetical protein